MRYVNTGPGMTKKRLLIVDDEPKFAEFIRKVALGLGYDVEATCCGRDFRDTYRSFKPTTIVLDMVMPDMDGNEVVQWLADQGCTAELIITSGYSSDYAADASRLAEFKGLNPIATMTKPIRVAELRGILGKNSPQ